MNERSVLIRGGRGAVHHRNHDEAAVPDTQRWSRWPRLPHEFVRETVRVLVPCPRRGTSWSSSAHPHSSQNHRSNQIHDLCDEVHFEVLLTWMPCEQWSIGVCTAHSSWGDVFHQLSLRLRPSFGLRDLVCRLWRRGSKGKEGTRVSNEDVMIDSLMVNVGNVSSSQQPISTWFGLNEHRTSSMSAYYLVLSTNVEEQEAALRQDVEQWQDAVRGELKTQWGREQNLTIRLRLHPLEVAVWARISTLYTKRLVRGVGDDIAVPIVDVDSTAVAICSQLSVASTLRWAVLAAAWDKRQSWHSVLDIVATADRCHAEFLRRSLNAHGVPSSSWEPTPLAAAIEHLVDAVGSHLDALEYEVVMSQYAPHRVTLLDALLEAAPAVKRLRDALGLDMFGGPARSPSLNGASITVNTSKRVMTFAVDVPVAVVCRIVRDDVLRHSSDVTTCEWQLSWIDVLRHVDRLPVTERESLAHFVNAHDADGFVDLSCEQHPPKRTTDEWSHQRQIAGDEHFSFWAQLERHGIHKETLRHAIASVSSLFHRFICHSRQQSLRDRTTALAAVVSSEHFYMDMWLGKALGFVSIASEPSNSGRRKGGGENHRDHIDHILRHVIVQPPHDGVTSDDEVLRQWRIVLIELGDFGLLDAARWPSSPHCEQDKGGVELWRSAYRIQCACQEIIQRAKLLCCL